jgi:hypothetical protein
LIALGGVVPATNSTKENLDATVGGRNRSEQGGRVRAVSVRAASVGTREAGDVLRNQVCQGVGIPLQIVDPSSQQGTTFRAAVDSSAAWFRCRYSALSVHLTRIILYVLGFGIRTDLSLADPPADWRNVRARPPRSLCVDLGYNAQATLLALASGTTTLEAIYGERGLDWDRETDQRVRELVRIKEKAQRAGLDPAEISAAALPAPPRRQHRRRLRPSRGRRRIEDDDEIEAEPADASVPNL